MVYYLNVTFEITTMDTLGARFLNENDESLSDNKYVLGNAERNNLENSSPEEQIASWLDTIEDIHTKHRDDPETMKRIKNAYHSRYVIKEKDFPKSYFTNNERRLREEGHGDYYYTDELKEEEIGIVQKNQKESLDTWIDYLTSEDSNYLAPWAKYWAFNGMLQLGRFNKETQEFEPRYKDTVAPFVELNPEALAYTAEILKNKYGEEYFNLTDQILDANSRLKKAEASKKGRKIVKLVEEQGVEQHGRIIIFTDENGKERSIKRRDFEKIKEDSSLDDNESVSEISKEIEELKSSREKVLDSSGIGNKFRDESRNEDFGKLYAYAIQKGGGADTELEIVEGEWVKYDKGGDHMKLYNSLYGKSTGWCTAGSESTAQKHLEGGDFYVYYSNNIDGEAVNPRIAIRMYGHKKIAEIRGVDQNQNLDKNISKSGILDEKLKEFGEEGEMYRVRVEDMKRVTQIEKKLEEEGALDRDELRFIFEIDRNIEGFGYKKDPRIENICNSFDPKGALAYIFECDEDDISLHKRDVLERVTLYHYGDLIFEEDDVNYGYYDDFSTGDVVKNFILPKRVFGNFELPSVEGVDNLVCPEEVNGDFTLGTYNGKSIVLPEKVDGSFHADYLTSLEGCTFPHKIGGDLHLRSLKKAEGLVIPSGFSGDLYLGSLKKVEDLAIPSDFKGDLILGITTIDGFILPSEVNYSLVLPRLRNARGLNFPKKFNGSLDMVSLETMDGLILPEEIDGGLRIGGFDILENFVAPKAEYIALFRVESLKNIDFSNIKGKVIIESVKEIEDVKFPDIYTDDLDFKNLEKQSGLLLPKELRGSLTFNGFAGFENLILPENIRGKLKISDVATVENFIAPQTEEIDFDDVTSLKDVDLRNVKKEICAGGVRSLENVVFPEFCDGDLNLLSLVEFRNVIFPKTVNGSLDICSLKDFSNISLPECSGNIVISIDVFENPKQMEELRSKYPNAKFEFNEYDWLMKRLFDGRGE